MLSKISSDSRKPRAISPLRCLNRWTMLVPASDLAATSGRPGMMRRAPSCKSTASGFSACSGSKTAGSSSYSTSSRSRASAAVSSSTAATAATASPTKRTLSIATGVWSWMMRPKYGSIRSPIRSSRLSTAATPASRSALEVSTFRTRACP